MSLRLLRIESPDDLHARAEAWDGLWLRSEVALPTKRAALLDQWRASFAKGCRFIALAVTEGDRFLAALPFVEERLARTFRVGRLPINSWCSSGDFLLDPDCDRAAVLACLVDGIHRLPWPLLWFDTIEIETRRWRALRAALAEAGLPVECRWQFDLGLIDIEHDWIDYRTRWSKNHRKQVARWLRRAHEQGCLELGIHRNPSLDAIDDLLAEGFEVEHRSWKGTAGTSVLSSPRALDFFRRQARLLASSGQLELIFLRLDGMPIAFEFGYHAKGVYFSHKVGYDEAYRSLAPGQLLMALQLERYFSEPGRRLVNCMGVLSVAVAKWCTRSRPIGRLIVGTGGPIGGGLVRAYRIAQPLWQRVREQYSGKSLDLGEPKLGAQETD